MKTVCKFFKGTLAVLMAAFFVACDIGLGAQVDVGTPEASITYPPAESVIRNAFVISGLCSDDLGVDKISVTLYQTDSESGKLVSVTDAMDAQILDKGSKNTEGSWKIELDPEKQNLTDGSYVAKVFASDKSGHKSSELSLSFAIDNHAPVFVLQNPTSKDISIPTEYGRSLIITGLASDDHTIKELNVKLYPKDDLENPINISRTNVTESELSSGITIAKYYDDVAKYLADSENNSKPTDEKLTLHKNYCKLYTGSEDGIVDVKNAVAKPYYITVELADNAMEYNGDEVISQESSRGNVTLYYYDKDDIYDDILADGTDTSASGVSGLKKIINGTSSLSQDTVENVIQILEKAQISTQLNEDGKNNNAVSINPDNSPVYTVLNADVANGIANNVKSVNEKINYTVQSGLDGVNVRKETFTVMFYSNDTTSNSAPLFIIPFTGVDINSNEYKNRSISTISNVTKDFNLPSLYPLYDDKVNTGLDPESIYTTNKEDELYPFNSELVKKVTLTDASNNSYDFLVPVDWDSNNLNEEKIGKGSSYFIKIGGLDKEGETLSASDGKTFGITIEASGAAPTVVFDKFDESKPLENLEDLSFFNNRCNNSSSDAMSFSGTITTDSESIKKITYTCAITSNDTKGLSIKKSLTTDNPSVKTDDGSFKTYDFNCNVYNLIKDEVIADTYEKDTLIYTVDVYAEDESGRNTTRSRTIYVDTTKPEVTLDDVVPSIESDGSTVKKVNGTFSIGGSITESNPSTARYYITCDGKQVYENTELNKSFSGSSSFSTTDNLASYNGKEIVLTVEFTDKAGNKGSDSKTYLLDQSSDAPSIVFDQSIDTDITSKDKIGNGINAFTSDSKTFKGTVTDDDGVGEVTFVFYKDGSTSAFLTKSIDGNGAKTFALPESGDNKIDVPSTQGYYDVEVTVKDSRQEATGYNSKSLAKFKIVYDEAAPVIDETSVGASGTKTKKPFTFKGSVTESNKVDTVIITDTSDSNKTYNTSCPQTADPSWSYTFTDEEFKALSEGAHVFVITATDVAGKTNSVTRTVTKDTLAPTIKDVKVLSSGVEVSGKGTVYGGSNNIKVGLNVNDSDVTEVEYSLDNKNWNAMSKKADDENYKWQTNVICEEGNNTIYFRAKDDASNDSAVTSLNAFLDLTGPVIKLISVDGESAVSSKLVNKKNNVSVVLSASDTLLDVTSVNLKQIDGVTKTKTQNGTKNAAGNWDVVLNTADMATGGVVFIASDASGNTTEFTAFQMSVDDEDPSVTINEITDADASREGVYVNKTFTVSGTASDNQGEISKVELYYSLDNSNWTQIEGVSGTSSWSKSIDSTSAFGSSIADNTTVYLKAVATDKALNSSETQTKIIVDQNTDRPIITFTNLCVQSSSKSLLQNGTIFVSAEDDDGNIVSLYYTTKESAATTSPDSSSDWTAFDLLSGGAAFKTSVSDGDGEKTWYLYAKDKKGSEFFSKATDNLNRLYLSDDFTDDSHKTKHSKQSNEYVNFILDTTAPVIDKFLIARTSSTPQEADWQDGANLVFGGSNQTMYLKLVVTEANGMSTSKPVVIEINSTPISISTPVPSVDKTQYTYIVGPVTVDNKFTDGTVPLKVTVYDAAGKDKTESKNILVDNTAPSLNVTSPATTTRIYSTVTVFGTYADNSGGSGIKSIKWMIPTVSDGVPTASSTGWKDTTDDDLTDASWEIAFDSTVEGNEYNPLTYASVTYDASGKDGLFNVPVYFLMEDQTGNKAISSTTMLVDLYGGRPVAEILYPSNGDSVGGSIRVYGTATDLDGTISEVHIALDLDGDGDFDKDDYDKVKTWVDNSTSPYAGNLVHSNEDTNYTDWGIKVNGAESWSCVINQASELEEFATNEKGINIRVRAYDNAGLTHGWYGGKTSDSDSTVTEKVHITINTDSPLYANKQPAVLRQYADNSNPGSSSNATVKEVAYEAGMYISGDWWYVVSVEDKQGIAAVYYSADTGYGDVTESFVAVSDKTATPVTTEIKTASGAVASPMQYSVSDEEYNTNSHRDFLIQIPINADRANSNGEIKSTVTITDASSSTNSSKSEVNIKIDNTAPSLYNDDGQEITASGSSAVRLVSGDDIIETVTQSNYSFTLGDDVTDIGSGFDKLVFYFERTNNSSNLRLFDPMLKIEDSAISIDGTNVKVNSEGLVVKTVTGKVSGASFTPSTATNISSDKSIRAGGLVKYLGSYYTISKVTDAGVVNLKTEVKTDGESVDFEFVYGQVVDHIVTSETPGSGLDANGNISVIEATDDGDGMIESVEKLGAKYTWTATVNSKHIKDGPVEVHVVAFDKAGNSIHGYRTVSVQNNRPRMTNVYLATDLNRDGKYKYSSIAKSINGIATYGEFSKFSALDATEKSSYCVSLDSENFTAKNNLLVIPEFVNDSGEITGNDAIGYIADIVSKDTADITTAKTGSVTLLDTTLSSVDGITDTIIKSFTAKGGFVMNNTTLSGTNNANEGARKIQVSFWDSTEGLVQGSSTQYAVVNIPLTINTVDKTKPFPSIRPFYWNGADDNSLYDNSTSNGHIELESDLPAGFTSDGSGVMDRDPKVSGKISVRGYAYDDTMLTSLKLKFDGFTFKTSAGQEIELAKYSDGKWTYPAISTIDGTLGWNFTLSDTDGPSQAGHFVEWQLDLDTSKIANVADVNKVLTIVASDGTNSSTASSVQTGSVTTTVYATDGQAEQSHFYASAKDAYEKGTTYAKVPGKASSNALTKGSEDSSYTGVYAYTYNVSDYYKMDVVPYITGVKTNLSSAKKSNPSVYSRTASGHYAVSSSETVTITGFNLSSTAASSITKDISSLTASGEFAVTVNSVSSLNNLNSNDSKGSYTETTTKATGDYSVYSNYYNRQPNNDNNNRLTDDVIFDIWQINSSAAKPISGIITDPVMKISPSSGMIGFAFTNGPLYFSMPGYVARYSRNNNTAGEYSYFYWQGSYDFMSSVGLAYDSNGYTYGCAAGGDINSTSADRFSFMTSRWGVSGAATSGSYDGSRANRLEAIGQINSSGVLDFDKNRIKSPSYATSYLSDGSTNVYLAYYDNMNGEIRFRAGNISSSSKGNFGNFNDSYRNNEINNYNNANNGKYTSELCQIVANSSGKGLGYSGEYVALGVIPKGSTGGQTDNDTVVMVWYDSTNSSLMYAYNTKPVTGTTGVNSTNWSTATTLLEDAGEYCQVAVDAAGGIHIAAYDGTNADLKYVYIDEYKKAAEAKSCTVDSYAIVGQNITIDVAKVGDYYVPFIGYYALSNNRPKYAKLASSTISDGVGSADDYTGVWEVSVIPTTSKTFQDRVNIGVWKTDAGVLKASTTGTSSASQYWGKCYGNGTANPVLGYAIKPSSSSGFIETAQMK